LIHDFWSINIHLPSYYYHRDRLKNNLTVFESQDKLFS